MQSNHTTPTARRKGAVTAIGAAAAGAAWGLFEAQWVERIRRDVHVPGLPSTLDGLRVAHLSDLHVGAPGVAVRSLARGINLAMAEAPDLVCITGDLRARLSGDGRLRAQLRRLSAPLGVFAVLGNHDHGAARDPFADGVVLRELENTGVQLLADEVSVVEHAGARIAIGGVAPETFEGDPSAAVRSVTGNSAELRILLCHYPEAIDHVTRHAWHLVLAGHHHGGQICLPRPGGKIRLSHGETRYLEGAYDVLGTTLHVSRGLGTTFVPFRFLARPEVTILRLHA